ncbi:MAG: TonB-dependent receptor [Comamonadaceae bacterium]
MENRKHSKALLRGAAVFNRTKLCTGLVIAFGGLAIAPGAVFAQDSTTLQRVEITGSSIKRFVDTDTALPISIISADELRQTGINSTEGALAKVVSSQSMQGSSQSVGSGTAGAAYANMRGLGSNKTLVLLNGRRVAAFAFSSSSVDLNSIPFAAVDRIEVLRDGASAIYGTDAIGGVINFITKKNYQGIDATVNYSRPQKDGGKKQGFALSAGVGDLDKDGYNIWFAADKQKNDKIAATQRDFGATGVIESKGLLLTSGTTFPGNFTQGTLAGNPTFAAGCKPPFSLSIPALSSKNCRFDYTALIDLVPETEVTTALLKGTVKLGSNLLTLEHMQTTNRNLTHVAPDPMTGLSMPPTSPFYPSTFPGIDVTKNISVGWRMIPAGPRTGDSNVDANRTVLSIEGSSGNIDYRAGLFNAESTGAQAIVSGYLNKTLIRSGIAAGKLNPFGEADATALGLIGAAQMTGTYSNAKGTTTGVDGNITTQFGSLAGGPISVSFGGEMRKEKYTNNTIDDIVNNVPSLGASPYHVTGDRDVYALSAEVLLPVMKDLEVTLAARYDKYSDFGSTFNPKVAFRWTPVQKVNVRGSYNTGFRAPSLDEIWGPQSVTYTADAYDDPLLCPNGVVAANGIESRDCGQQAQILAGGNPALKPEKSKTFTFGVAFEPVKNFTASVDYWNVRMTDSISGFPEQAIFADPSKYATRYMRCSQLSADVQSNLDRCANEWANSNALGYVIGLTDNLGDVRTDGFDFAAGYGFTSGASRFNLNWEATYVRSYEYQHTSGDAFIQNVGKYSDSSPVLRWVHNFGANWKTGDFLTTVNVGYKSGYTDQNAVDPQYVNEVKSYTVTDVAVTWSGIKHTKLTFGVKNLFDVAPPFSNQGTTFQKGYDPRLTDAAGRTLLVRANVSF